MSVHKIRIYRAKGDVMFKKETWRINAFATMNANITETAAVTFISGKQFFIRVSQGLLFLRLEKFSFFQLAYLLSCKILENPEM